MEFQSRAPALARDPSEGHVQGQQAILWPIQDCLQVQVPSVVNGSMNEDKNVCICESESQTELIESEIKYLNSIIVAPSKMLVSNPPLSSSPPNCGYEELTASLTKYPTRRSSFYEATQHAVWQGKTGGSQGDTPYCGNPGWVPPPQEYHHKTLSPPVRHPLTIKSNSARIPQNQLPVVHLNLIACCTVVENSPMLQPPNCNQSCVPAFQCIPQFPLVTTTFWHQGNPNLSHCDTRTLLLSPAHSPKIPGKAGKSSHLDLIQLSALRKPFKVKTNFPTFG